MRSASTTSVGSSASECSPVSSKIDVLEVIVEEVDQGRCFHTHDSGVWRQWMPPAAVITQAEKSLARYHADEAVRAANLENKRKYRSDPEKWARELEQNAARKRARRQEMQSQPVHHADNGKNKPLCGKIATKIDVVVEKAIMSDCPACIEKAGLSPLVEAKKHEPTVMDNADADTLLKVARQLVEHISKAPELVGSAAGDLAETFRKLDELACIAKRPKAWQ